MSIHLLPPEVASQIAAGEVVERPASVVKELLENGLDAGSTRVAITIEGAGKRLVEVSDDGQGIPVEELSLAVTRHATSKLSTAQDLFCIETLGFRGEALASIGSVARLTIVSRTADSAVGARIRVEGGLVGHPEPTGAPQGTLVRVEDLFYNVPARMKFLKQDATERRQIDELVTRYALSYPGVQITLRQEGRITLQTSGKGERREVLAALHGVDLARQMIEVLAEEDGLRITGFISPTSLTKSNRRDILFFINGRPVQDSTLSAALLQAYHTLLMVGRYPLATIFLEIPPQAVDVNVHPTKAEVRFREPDTIFRGVQRAVRRALLAHTPIPELAGPAPAGPLPRWFPGEFQRGSSGERIPDPAWSYATNGNSIEPATATAPVQPELEKGHIPLLRPVGQIAAAYLVAEGPDGLYLIDQHAAHERVLFERFMRQWESQGTGMPGQALLTPQTISLSMASSQLIEGQLPLIEKMGFQVEVFGPGMFRIRAIPALLSGLDPADALRVLVEDFEEDETPLQAELETRMIARVCKRAAVKAGQVLSSEEQRALLADLEACRSPRTCPHGRPTMIHLSLGLLERQFGRLGPRSHGA